MNKVLHAGNNKSAVCIWCLVGRLAHIAEIEFWLTFGQTTTCDTTCRKREHKFNLLVMRARMVVRLTSLKV